METIPINTENVAVLTVLLVALGKSLKTIPTIPNNIIPIVLALVGGLVSSWLSSWDAKQFIAGACCGLMAVGSHQVVQQLTPTKTDPTTPLPGETKS